MITLDRPHSRRAAVAVALLGAALVAGCGGDDEPAAGTEARPPLTVPGESTEPTPTEEATTEAATEPAPPPPPAEPAPAPPPPPPPPPADSPEDDQPPPEGSPAERFEQYCDENPDAC